MTGGPVTVTAPTSNQVFGPTTSAVTVTVTAPGYSSVTILGDSVTLGTGAPPLSLTWSGIASGSHTVRGTATGLSSGCVIAGAGGQTFSIEPKVNPTVSMSAPTSSAAWSSIPFSASVSGPYPISKVSYYSGSTLLASTTTPPYSFTWPGAGTGVAPGSYTLSASATDIYGDVGASISQVLNVSAAPLPVVSVSAPNSVAPAQILVSSSVSSPFAISQVAYYSGATLLGTSGAAPWSYLWSGSTFGNATGLAPGTYPIQAYATDIHGDVGSGSASITVGASSAPIIALNASASRSMLPATLSMSASVGNESYTVQSLSFNVNGVSYPVTPGTSGTLSLALPTAGNSAGVATTYSITASAADHWGGVVTSSPTTIAETAHPAPTVILSPVQSSVEAPATLSAQAAASDVDGVKSVALLLNSIPQTSLSAPPYTFEIGGIGPGSYTVAAQATDNVGVTSNSAPQTITVAANPTFPTQTSKTQTRTASFDYDPNTGLLTKEVVEPEDSNLCQVTSYTHDQWGNGNSAALRNCNGSVAVVAPYSGSAPAEAAAPSAGTDAVIATRTNSTQFDARGQFPNIVTNAKSQQETRAYSVQFGAQTLLTGPNGLTTSWQYDAFGRKALETRADGTQSTYAYSDCTTTGGCSVLARYSLTKTTTGSPTTILFFDYEGRAIYSFTQTFTGEAVRQDLFDDLGRQTTSSRLVATTGTSIPDFSAVSSSSTFDVMGRPITVTGPAMPNGTRPVMSYQRTALTSGATMIETDPNGNSTTTQNNEVGKPIWIQDAAGNYLRFNYDSFNNVVATDASEIEKTASFDIRGRKLSTTDPDMGTWTYTYDALGEAVSQTDPKQQRSTMTYDPLGRMLTRSEPDATSTWEYDIARPECGGTAGKAIGSTDASTTSQTGYLHVMCFDSLARPASEIATIGTVSYKTSRTYDSASHIGTMTFPAGKVYPSGLTVSYQYSASGVLSQISNSANGSVIWAVTSMDANAQFTAEVMAGGTIATSRVFDNLGRVETISTSTASATIQNDTFTFDGDGNLSQRSWLDNASASHAEAFVYDSLSRVESVSGASNNNFTYDAWGDIKTKTFAGATNIYSYAAGTHRLTAISGTVNGVVNPAFAYDVDANQKSVGNIVSGAGLTASWTSFNMPITLQRGSVTDTFTYGPQHERVRQVSSSSSGSMTTIYVGKAYESVTNSSTGVTEFHSYIIAAGRRVAMFIDRSDGSSAWRYFHQDHLGSVEVVTDQTGAVIERLSYDVWGRRRNLDGSDSATAIVAIDSRGYTDHEMLDSISMINMNGRIYDPMLGRFISADPSVQNVFDLQSYNTYSYVRNNPLSLTDPTGFSWWTRFRDHWLKDIAAIAIAIEAPELATYLGVSSDVGLISFYASVGFVSGYITGGNLQSATLSAFTAGVLQPIGAMNDPGMLLLGHAFAGCVTGAGGGSGGAGCGRGALIGVVAETATLGSANILGTSASLEGFSAAVVSGGAVARLSGGRFAEGAATSAFLYLYNANAHQDRWAALEAKSVAQLEAADYTVLRYVRISWEGANGAYAVIDAVGFKDGILVIIDSKSGDFASLTPNQKSVFMKAFEGGSIFLTSETQAGLLQLEANKSLLQQDKVTNMYLAIESDVIASRAARQFSRIGATWADTLLKSVSSALAGFGIVFDRQANLLTPNSEGCINDGVCRTQVRHDAE